MAPDSCVALHWFRKGLRLHDNPGLLEALRSRKTTALYPTFCIDPYFAKPEYIGVNRYNFLLESLIDLDSSLKSLGSRLFVIQGKPEEALVSFVKERCVQLVTFESDTEPYAKARDDRVVEILVSQAIEVKSFSSHTLYDMESYLRASSTAPSSYGAFCKTFSSLGRPRAPLPSPTISDFSSCKALDADIADSRYDVPSLRDMGYQFQPTTTFRGGETVAKQRLLETVVQRQHWAASFEKPNTPPNSIEPSTTVLSPYLKFGSLSAALLYAELDKIYRLHPKHALPPVSLHGQLLWREFFYLHSSVTPNFDRMAGNPSCRQIPWDNNPELLQAWADGRTGFPFIDAAMTQLRVQGWIHHLARHAVACFLTRGDLWQSWEAGARVFDALLLDADWALNNANWQWLSCSNFFYQYFRCYSPVAFGKKTDKNGDYIRHWLPQLAKFPAQYIYEPWKAPLSVQEKCGCVIGRDYPRPILDHDSASKANMAKMKAAYSQHSGAKIEETSMERDVVAAVTTSSSSSDKKRKAPPLSKDKKAKTRGSFEAFFKPSDTG